MFCDCFCRSYGSVYKALHKESGQVLAIKQVPVDTDLQEIIKEISIMQQCDSVFIVKYYGSYFKNTDLWVRLCSVLKPEFNKSMNIPVHVLSSWMYHYFNWLTIFLDCVKRRILLKEWWKLLNVLFFLKISRYQHELKLKHAFYMCPKN